MSYDISLLDAETGQTILLDHPHDLRGGTVAVGGTREAWLNVTYNYGHHYKRVIDAELGIKWLHEKVALDTIPKLCEAIMALGCDEDTDYWKDTEGNARRALSDLLQLAFLAPKGVWEVQ